MNRLLLPVILTALLALSSAQNLKVIPFASSPFLGRTIDQYSNSTTSQQFLVADLLLDNLVTFSIPVDFGADYVDSNKELRTMMLAISSSSSVLTNLDFRSFYAYNCSGANCTLDAADDKNTQYQVTVSGNSPCSLTRSSDIAKHPISFGDNAWTLSTPVFFDTPPFTCMVLYPFGEYYGVLGLGTSQDSLKNYKDSHVVFSFSFEADNGSFILGNDTTKATNLKTMLPANENWEMTVVNVTFNGINLSANSSASTTMIFDLQQGMAGEGTPDIILPAAISKSFASALCGIKDTKCSGSYIGSYSRNVPDLPDLVFTLKDGSKLSIPASLYLKTIVYEDETNGTEANFQAPTMKSSENEPELIVLGWTILSNFYSVFERTNDVSRIGLYSTSRTKVTYTGPMNTAVKTEEDTPSGTPSTPPTSSGSSAWIWIVLILLIAVGGAGYWYYTRKYNRVLLAQPGTTVSPARYQQL